MAGNERSSRSRRIRRERSAAARHVLEWSGGVGSVPVASDSKIPVEEAAAIASWIWLRLYKAIEALG
jgi:hypothetical protein